MKKYDKLVRDHIPKIINKNGHKCKFHVANEKEFVKKLGDKLLEEAKELIEKPNAEEIGDVLEVIEEIARINNISLEEIKLNKVDKKKHRGGFTKRIILDSSDE